MRPKDGLANYVDLDTFKHILTYTQNFYPNYFLTGSETGMVSLVHSSQYPLEVEVGMSIQEILSLGTAYRIGHGGSTA